MEKKERVYISLPINLSMGDVRERYLEGLQYLQKLYKGKEYEIQGPANIGQFFEDINYDGNGVHYAVFMGKDIENLLQCDTILMCRGWHQSLGCRTENAAAKIYGLKVIYQFC